MITLKITFNELNQLPRIINFLTQEKIDFHLSESNQEEAKSAPKVIPPNRQIRKQFGRYGIKVLNLLAKGYSYEKIATELEITTDGVRYYIKKVFKTLGVNNGRDAVRIYLTQKDDINSQFV